MAVFVNYYPCSYGESLVNMFGKVGASRLQNIVQASVPTFKLPEFYSLDLLDREKILQNLDQKFYACHRQNGIKFTGHFTISIVLDICDFLPARYQSVHLLKYKNCFGNDKLNQLINKLPLDQLILKDYNIWTKNNILNDDVVLMFSWIINNNNKLKEFCKNYELHYDQSCIDEIKNDYKRWIK